MAKKPPSAPARSKRLPADDRRALIIDAARQVFLEYGYTGARTQAIAAAAGINQALLFRHFESKEELFQEAVIAPLERVMEGASAYPESVTPAELTDVKREHTEAVIAAELRTMVDAAPLLGVVLFGDREMGARFYKERVVPVLERGAQRSGRDLGRWEHRNFDPRLVTTAVFGMCFAVAVDAYFTGEELDVDATAREFAALVFDGVATQRADRGRKNPRKRAR